MIKEKKVLMISADLQAKIAMKYGSNIEEAINALENLNAKFFVEERTIKYKKFCFFRKRKIKQIEIMREAVDLTIYALKAKE